MTNTVAINTPVSTDGKLHQERQLLALEALSKLANQFAKNPDLQYLIDSVVLTVAGQFAVTSAMIVTKSNTLDTSDRIYSATGKFRRTPLAADFFDSATALWAGRTNPTPCNLDELTLFENNALVMREWRELGVRVIAPLVVNGAIIGVILLGSRIDNRTFSQDALDLLGDVTTTITPLIANSLLYADMAALSARHLQILDSVRQAIFVYDHDGILLMVNRAAISITASLRPFDAPPLVKGISIESTFPDDVFPGWAERLRQAQKDPRTPLAPTMIARGQTSERVFAVSVCFQLGRSWSKDGMILTLDDKTDERNNERRMFELEKFAEQGVMASSISHELNNHLALILGGIELAQVAQEKGNQEKVLKTLARLRESVSRMERFTAGLTDFSRINASVEPVQLNNLLTGVLSFASAQRRFTGVRFKTDFDSHLPLAPMDGDQIAQVVINLLNNAADAIAETDHNDGLITVSTKSNDGQLILRVADNGCGMTPEVRDKLFKTHFTTKPNGHGYGMITCGKILDHHHVRVSFESEVGLGTTFELRFPHS